VLNDLYLKEGDIFSSKDFMMITLLCRCSGTTSLY